MKNQFETEGDFQQGKREKGKNILEEQTIRLQCINQNKGIQNILKITEIL